MGVLTHVTLAVAIVSHVTVVVTPAPAPEDDAAVDQANSVDRRLHIRSFPEIRGYVSNLYEVYMPPYRFDIPPVMASVELRGQEADEGNSVNGELIFTQPQPPVGPVFVRGNITGLSPGLHGIHVHVFGSLKDGCESAGPHFNPFSMSHGGPGSPARHVGDLGNVRAGEDGVATIDLVDPIISLTGAHHIVGRSIVVHANQDDFGVAGTEESIISGSSGPPVACGTIGYANWMKSQ